jgi:hypothetical protein
MRFCREQATRTALPERSKTERKSMKHKEKSGLSRKERKAVNNLVEAVNGLDLESALVALQAAHTALVLKALDKIREGLK